MQVKIFTDNILIVSQWWSLNIIAFFSKKNHNYYNEEKEI